MKAYRQDFDAIATLIVGERVAPEPTSNMLSRRSFGAIIAGSRPRTLLSARTAHLVDVDQRSASSVNSRELAVPLPLSASLHASRIGADEPM